MDLLLMRWIGLIKDYTHTNIYIFIYLFIDGGTFGESDMEWASDSVRDGGSTGTPLLSLPLSLSLCVFECFSFILICL